ncbi:CGNR zinc finger domain-containing protein [Streptomyces malaysiensis]|uniref:CGNR zinc finger domain-containing protein n=1 Tax=Streptomyces malaysiensis TaxID=92644 RepID=UPI0036901E2E
MEELATDRLRLPAGRAPGGLCLVQELVNTSTRLEAESDRVADLLTNGQDANRWLAAALRQWADAAGQQAPALQLAEADLGPLRRLREAMRDLVGARSGPRPSQLSGTSIALRIDAEGHVVYGTTAGGWRAVAALVTAEILLAQHAGTWQRFKTCPYPVCGIAFYDESRNNSRVWHDVRTCGNRTNLAAARGRRRMSEAGDAADRSQPAADRSRSATSPA